MLRLPCLNQTYEPCKAAAIRKPQVVKGRSAVEIQKLIIDGNQLVVFVTLGDQARNLRLDADRAKVLQYADPFVAFLNKIAVDIFIDLDWLPDPLGDMGIV